MEQNTISSSALKGRIKINLALIRSTEQRTRITTTTKYEAEPKNQIKK